MSNQKQDAVDTKRGIEKLEEKPQMAEPITNGHVSENIKEVWLCYVSNFHSLIPPAQTSAVSLDSELFAFFCFSLSQLKLVSCVCY